MLKVKCVKPGEDVDYLTAGKVYDVKGLWVNQFSQGFTILDDNDEVVCGSLPMDLHAEWEIVE